MNTLIIPCAGRSSRFPGMRPKYLLTHPDGQLMVQKSMEGLDLELFDRIIITIVKPHDEQYEALLVLKQAFEGQSKVEICTLDDFTASASETVCLTLQRMKVKGAFVIKDSDNRVEAALPSSPTNAIVGYDLHQHPDVTQVSSKSFLLLENDGSVRDIIEKQVVSPIVCLGVYSFESAEEFCRACDELQQTHSVGEMYISHVISHMISQSCRFKSIMATGYDDWGTLAEWRAVQKKCSAWFVDFDGVLIKNSGRYGKVNWSNNRELLKENVAQLKKIQAEGGQVIIATSRPEPFRKLIVDMLSEEGFEPNALLMGMNHAPRILVNDFAATNPYPSCLSISLPRNASLKDYIE